MLTTTMFVEGSGTRTWNGHVHQNCPAELLQRYEALVLEQRLSWTEHHRFIRRLGRGGQGEVYLSERRGTDNFTLPVAIKVFSPENYDDENAYDVAMARMAQVAARVATIQQDNLLDVHNWVERRRIRFMEMEWVDGFDLSRLLNNRMLDFMVAHSSHKRWEHINRVTVTAGPAQPRVKPGLAIAIVRDCLSALAALHRNGIVHGDVKPGNIMLKRTGNAKIVDIGSAFELNEPPPARLCTPYYAAPEVLERRESSPQSDLASLGYVLIEMLSGRPAYEGEATIELLLEDKRFLAQRLTRILPHEVTVNDLLMSFIGRLVAPDPSRRFSSAEDAELVKDGAAAFHRQLVISNLSSEYDNEIRLWLEAVQGME